MTNTFKHRFWKYEAAMKACPTARFAELIPIANLQVSPGVLFDLMGGSGYVSEHLGVYFEKTYLIDQCSSHFPGYNREKTTYIHADAAHIDFQNLALPPADSMVCLAGFHHLPEEPVSPSADAVNAFRTEVLKSWRSGLRVGGRLIIADVASDDAVLPIGQLDEKELEKRLSNVTALRGVNMSSPDMNPQPAKFLNRFVNEESIGGHDCQFENVTSIKQKLEAAGYCNIDARVYYTPWVFSNKMSAIGFVAELFGIGDDPSVSQEGKLLPVGLKTLSAIEKYLGMDMLPDGRCVIHWKLLYAWGDRCDD